MTKVNSQSGERLSFYQLLVNKQYKIKIPIIQRDYAQGRASSEELREVFIKALYSYLEENIPFRDLDFVYGSLVEEKNTLAFVPLDGQQRLTTLFLLHWYLCQLSGNDVKKEEFRHAICKNGISIFTYETRPSSTDFCNELVKYHLADFQSEKISEVIKNNSWFYLSWEQDPTIKSMLNMLDTIHKYFKNSSSFFERLIDLEKPVITFLFLNLEDFKLTDELYIKMNSRGKTLTDFEKLKAKLEQHIEQNFENSRTFYLEYNIDEPKQVSFKEYFSYNIDTKWANLFWKYRNNSSNKKENTTFDKELMNFIRIIFTFQYALGATEKERGNLDLLIRSNDVTHFNYYKCEELGILSDKTILFLCDALDVLENGNDKIKTHLPDEYHFYFGEEKIFNKVLEDNLSYSERISFYAYISFLIKNNSVEGIEQWMRVIHNLSHAENVPIDTSLDFANLIKTIENLLPHSKNILEYFKADPTLSHFAQSQIFEEKIKSYLITKNENWQKAIEDIEKHTYFNGQIGFILELTGISKYYLENQNCDWGETEEKYFYGLFSNYANIASVVFEGTHEKLINNQNWLLERAVLTKGDYLKTATSSRKSLLSSRKPALKRDYSWKKHLELTQSKIGQFVALDYLKDVFDDERFNINNLQKSLEVICEDRTATWRDYFIDDPRLFEYCQQGFIRFEDENNILLYSQSQSNHYHVELYTYFLYLNEILPLLGNNEFKMKCENLFEYISYDQSRSIDNTPRVYFECYKYERKRFNLAIYSYYDEELEDVQYEFAFMKEASSGNLYDVYPYKLLEKIGFEWVDELSYFSLSVKYADVADTLSNLINSLDSM